MTPRTLHPLKPVDLELDRVDNIRDSVPIESAT